MERVGVDVERLGKRERQAGLGTWMSPHTVDDLARLAPHLHPARPFARVNPLHPATADEVGALLTAGAQVLMLPMVESAGDAARFLELLGGRAAAVLLVETARGLEALPEILTVPGVQEVHLGLNDLALSCAMPNRWHALVDPRTAQAAERVLARGCRLGLGGLGRPDDAALPVPPRLVYAESVRLGSQGALLSRSFLRSPAVLAADVARSRAEVAAWRGRSPGELEHAHGELVRHAHGLPRW